MVKEAETTTILEDKIPNGWQKGTDLDPEITKYFTSEYVHIVPKQDDDQDAHSARVTLEKVKGEIGDDIIVVLQWDDSYHSGWRRSFIKVADLSKNPTQLLREKMMAVQKNHNRLLIEAKTSALIATDPLV